MGERKDLSEERWFQRSLVGETCIVKRMLDGEEVVVLSMPVQDEGRNTFGVLYQVFSINEFRRLTNTDAFDGQALFCIIESDGSLVMGTEDIGDFFSNHQSLLSGVEPPKISLRKGASAPFPLQMWEKNDQGAEEKEDRCCSDREHNHTV